MANISDIPKSEMLDLYLQDLLYNIVNLGDKIVAKVHQTSVYSEGQCVRCDV